MLGGDPVDSPSRVIGLAGVFGLGALNTLHPKGALSSKLQKPAQALERHVRVVADPQVAAKGTLCRLVAKSTIYGSMSEMAIFRQLSPETLTTACCSLWLVGSLPPRHKGLA